MTVLAPIAAQQVRPSSGHDEPTPMAEIEAISDKIIASNVISTMCWSTLFIFT